MLTGFLIGCIVMWATASTYYYNEGRKDTYNECECLRECRQ